MSINGSGKTVLFIGVLVLLPLLLLTLITPSLAATEGKHPSTRPFQQNEISEEPPYATYLAYVSTAAIPVTILPNHSSYISKYSGLNIVGEVQNNSADILASIIITVDIFDDQGSLLASESNYTYLRNLPQGDKSCFRISLNEEPANWDHYAFKDVSYRTDGVEAVNLVVLNDSGSHDPTYGRYEILGQVRNDESFVVENVKPVATLYDASGTVFDCGLTYVDTTDLGLNPGQTSPFDITLVGRDFAGVDSYRLQVDGNKPRALQLLNSR